MMIVTTIIVMVMVMAMVMVMMMMMMMMENSDGRTSMLMYPLKHSWDIPCQ